MFSGFLPRLLREQSTDFLTDYEQIRHPCRSMMADLWETRPYGNEKPASFRETGFVNRRTVQRHHRKVQIGALTCGGCLKVHCNRVRPFYSFFLFPTAPEFAFRRSLISSSVVSSADGSGSASGSSSGFLRILLIPLIMQKMTSATSRKLITV